MRRSGILATLLADADAGKVWDTSAPLPGVNAYWQLDDEASSAPLVIARR